MPINYKGFQDLLLQAPDGEKNYLTFGAYLATFQSHLGKQSLTPSSRSGLGILVNTRRNVRQDPDCATRLLGLVFFFFFST